jgi:hypothetical protein
MGVWIVTGLPLRWCTPGQLVRDIDIIDVFYGWALGSVSLSRKVHSFFVG